MSWTLVYPLYIPAYTLYTGVHTVYWCTHYTLAYTLYTGVHTILVYPLYTGVHTVYWCTHYTLAYTLYTGVHTILVYPLYTGVHTVRITGVHTGQSLYTNNRYRAGCGNSSIVLVTPDKMAEGCLSDHSPHFEIMYSTQVLEWGELGIWQVWLHTSGSATPLWRRNGGRHDLWKHYDTSLSRH